jgi:GT2 family glycosyltransferase
MITVIYSTHKDETYNKKFKEHLQQTVGVKNIQILEYVNHNQFGLPELYNKGISESVNNIIVCCHNDIKLENGWGRKLLKDFENNPDYGIIGKAGSCYFPESGVYWEHMNFTMVGQVYHHPDGQQKFLSKYTPKHPFLIPVVTIDGLFIAFDKTKIKHTFDETIGKFHFYDHPFCLSNYLDGVKIGVTNSFEITHKSVGYPNQEFFDSKDVFLQKFGDKLPLDLKPKKPYIETIKPFNNKKGYKVAVIIPTKNNVQLLFQCVNSFYKNCNPNLFSIFIADTGSTDEEKEWIKNNILNLGDIRLIEYDYYNFAKINNDVVKNHVTEDFNMFLFCNNDVILQNNVIDSMLKIFNDNSKTGTVGARLHYPDNRVQHDGILMFVKDDKLNLTHLGAQTYYKYNTNVKEVVGSTGALLMIRKNIFESIGMFNESYINCLEDVELNLRCKLLGLTNFTDGKSVAYHLESYTRNQDQENITKLKIDFENVFMPFIIENQNKLNHLIEIK